MTVVCVQAAAQAREEQAMMAQQNAEARAGEVRQQVREREGEVNTLLADAEVRTRALRESRAVAEVG